MRCCSVRNFSASSPPLPPVHLPSPMETHLWYVVPDEVNCGSLLGRYTEILSPAEKKNVLCFPEEQLQKRALLARTLVRTTIARYQIHDHVDPRCIKFRRNIHGKPEVEWQIDHGWSPPPLHFNISHTSSLIACGVTVGSRIGIDVEEKQRKLKNNILAFARRYFSCHEVEFLSSVSDSEVQRQEFIKLWTLKEAYVKALGKGFSASPFKTFSIRVNTVTKRGIVLPQDLDIEASEIMVESSDDPHDLADTWQFALVELAGSHYAAICMEKDKTSEVGTKLPIKLTAWKTIPLAEDECVSGTDKIKPISLLKQF
ncbi:4'-phosphopantetheinyl transferase superfamily [Euphorbia peplus]|nr:4'-phosphopantetheinyl transferase superfamily [Euphorbia peplus]